jgi:hypothetical protein
MVEPWQGRALSPETAGNLSNRYVAHGDPASSGDNFGWTIAHREGPDDHGRHHLVVDRIHYWCPGDYPDHTIDFLQVEEEIWADIVAFGIEEVTFDNHNSVQLIQGLQRRAQESGRRVHIHAFNHTAASNQLIAENLRTALHAGLVHAPPHPLLEGELKFLTVTRSGRVDHPTSGPVATNDLATCLMVVTQVLIGENGADIFVSMSAMRPQASNPADQAVFAQLSDLGSRRYPGRGLDPSRGRGGPR